MRPRSTPGPSPREDRSGPRMATGDGSLSGLDRSNGDAAEVGPGVDEEQRSIVFADVWLGEVLRAPGEPCGHQLHPPPRGDQDVDATGHGGEFEIRARRQLGSRP